VLLRCDCGTEVVRGLYSLTRGELAEHCGGAAHKLPALKPIRQYTIEVHPGERYGARVVTEAGLSECLINGPMSPIVTGRCQVGAVAGVLRWAGAGPVFLDV
jgi:hypothetical protein